MSTHAMQAQDHDVRRPANPLRAGLTVAVVVIAVHTIGGNFANEWDGWDVALGNVLAGTILGALALALTFGLLVRPGLRAAGAGNRPARMAVVTGMIGVVSYVVFFTGAPAVVGAGALALGLRGLQLAREGRGGRHAALTGLVLGLANIAFALGFYATEIVAGLSEHWV